jgi:transcriptional regulator with XRE-family HTH domain
LWVAGSNAGDPDLTSIYSDEYRQALRLLVLARKQAGITQQRLAVALDRPQSFVSKFELGERRLDIGEFLRITRLLGIDPCALLQQMEKQMPAAAMIKRRKRGRKEKARRGARDQLTYRG